MKENVVKETIPVKQTVSGKETIPVKQTTPGKENGKRELAAGIALLAAFVLWTVLVRCADVQPAGPGGSRIGLAGLNVWFHRLTGVHMTLYTVTDWMGLVPVAVCLGFGSLGLVQLIRRKSLFRVDADLILLGVYYVLIFFCYLFFEAVPVNYRPVLIDGVLEASYPSSTTLLVLGVMPTLKFQADRRLKHGRISKAVAISAALFSAFMVAGRLISGVHWLTDIAGAVLLSAGLFMLYRYAVSRTDRKKMQSQRKERTWNSTKSCRN